MLAIKSLSVFNTSPRNMESLSASPKVSTRQGAKDSYFFFSTIVILHRHDGPVFPKPINRGEELSQRDEERHELAWVAQGMNA
jgi:hypothetical protein